MKYKRKATYVEAVQWTGDNCDKIEELCAGTSSSITTNKYGTGTTGTSSSITTNKYGIGIECGVAWHALCDKMWVVKEKDHVWSMFDAEFKAEFEI